MTRRRRLIIRIAVAVLVVGGIAWWMVGRQRGEEPPAAAAAHGSGSARVVPVRLAKVVRQDVPIWIEGLGTVAAAQQVTVRPQVDGRLDRVPFVEGQEVRAGDLLAEIDPRPFLAQLHQTEGALARDRAQLAVARRNYERYRGLFEQQLVAKMSVDQYEGEVGQLEGAIRIDLAAIENARLQVDYTRVKAPLAGVTGIRQVDAGNLVHVSDANGLVVITAMDPAAVLFTVPQDRLPQIVAAQARGSVAVEVSSRDGSSRLGAGTLAVVDNQINQTTATLRLKALIPNPQRALWPNAFVKARMLVDTRTRALVVPAVAVQQGPQGPFVYVVRADRTAQLVPVTIAQQLADLVVIEKGVAEGDQVVIEGANQLRQGSRVEPIVEKQPRAQS